MLQNVIVDTSVLVSAFLFPKSTPGRVLLLADQGVFAMHLSPIILEELKRSFIDEFLQQWGLHSYLYSKSGYHVLYQLSAIPRLDMAFRAVIIGIFSTVTNDNKSFLSPDTK